MSTRSREDMGKSFRRSLSKAGSFIIGAPIHKQLKVAILEGNEEKAITLYMSKDGSKLHPSKPFPTKKAESTEDTPMHLAAKHVLVRLLRMFLEYGGNPGVRNARLETCAHVACQLTSYPGKRAEILDAIFDWRGTKSDNTVDFVPIDAVDVYGNTVLHIASYTGLLPCVEKLILRGAPLAVFNAYDCSCCEMADKGGHVQLGTMLELAWVFKVQDERQDALQTYNKHAQITLNGGILLDVNSIHISGLIEYINKSVKYIAEAFGESSARAEVLLNCGTWDVKKLKKEVSCNYESVLVSAHLKTRKVELKNASKVAKEKVNVGVDLEDMYFDPCYQNVASFTIYYEGKKKIYTLRQESGKTTVCSINYNAELESADNVATFSEKSVTQPSYTVSCPLCGEKMFEPASIQQFLIGNVVEPGKREIHCGSDHKYCLNCWSDHVIALMNKENAGCLCCPAINCGEILDYQWAPIILKKSELVNRLLAQRQKRIIETLNLKWCPVPNCGLLVHVPPTNNFQHNHLNQSASITMSGSFSNAVTPPTAVICGNGHSFCLLCSNEAHSPCRCNDVMTWQELIREESASLGPTGSNPLALLLRSYPYTKPCFRCGNTVIKNDGCNIVTCTHCLSKSCWTCMQEWVTHGQVNNNIFYCNRFTENTNNFHSNPGSFRNFSGMMEEKTEDDFMNFRRNKVLRLQRLLHHCTRFVAHSESIKLEYEARRVAEERISEGLRASLQGDLTWLYGDLVPNPMQEEEQEKHAYSTLRNKEDEITMTNFYLSKDQSIQFLTEAYDELQKCRTFLKWTYPFAMIEFTERNSKQKDSSNSSRARWKERTEDVHADFDLLQASLEYLTESLSDLISRKRLRATKTEIVAITHSCKAKRLEFEQFVNRFYAHYYTADELAAHEPISANSSITTISSSKRMSLSNRITSPVARESQEDLHAQNQMNNQVHVMNSVDSLLADVTSYQVDAAADLSDGEEEKVKTIVTPPLLKKTASFLDKSSYYKIDNFVPKSNMPAANANTNTTSVVQIESQTIFESAAETKTIETQSETITAPPQQTPAQQTPPPALQPLPTGTPSRGLVRVGSTLSKDVVAASMTQDKNTKRRGTIFIESLYRPVEAQTPPPPPVVEVVPPPVEEPPVQVPPPKVEIKIEEPVVQKVFEVIREPMPPQVIIEQRLIAPKKDPDQEAFEHAIMISQQEQEYGINMYDALTPEDEPVIDEYMAQGFTREEAILIIFEEKFGIGTKQQKKLTPAMPTLHKLSNEISSGASISGTSTVVVASNGILITEEDEQQVEELMVRGYTREQAVEAIGHRKRRELEAALTEETLPSLVDAATANYNMQEDARRSGNNNYPPQQHYDSMSSLEDNAVEDLAPMNPEDYAISQLVSQGFTHEQALAILSSRHLSTTEETRTNNMEMNEEFEEQDPQIIRLMSQGFTREQAVQYIADSNQRNYSRAQREQVSTSHDQHRAGSFTSQHSTYSAEQPRFSSNASASQMSGYGMQSAQFNPNHQYSQYSQPNHSIYRAAANDVRSYQPRDEYYQDDMRSTDMHSRNGNYDANQSAYFNNAHVGYNPPLPPHQQMIAMPPTPHDQYDQESQHNSFYNNSVSANNSTYLPSHDPMLDDPEVQRLIQEGLYPHEAINHVRNFRRRLNMQAQQDQEQTTAVPNAFHNRSYSSLGAPTEPYDNSDHIRSETQSSQNKAAPPRPPTTTPVRQESFQEPPPPAKNTLKKKVSRITSFLGKKEGKSAYKYNKAELKHLVEMGFNESLAIQALVQCRNDVTAAIAALTAQDDVYN